MIQYPLAPEEDISIHASREGGDWYGVSYNPGETNISIHASREGGDLPPFRPHIATEEFQSTPPVREATLSRLCGASAAQADFNPRLP